MSWKPFFLPSFLCFFLLKEALARWQWVKTKDYLSNVNNSEYNPAYSLSYVCYAAISSILIKRSIIHFSFWDLGVHGSLPKGLILALGVPSNPYWVCSKLLYYSKPFFIWLFLFVLSLSKSQKHHQFHVNYIFLILYRVLFIISALTIFFSFYPNAINIFLTWWLSS